MRSRSSSSLDPSRTLDETKESIQEIWRAVPASSYTFVGLIVSGIQLLRRNGARFKVRG